MKTVSRARIQRLSRLLALTMGIILLLGMLTACDTGGTRSNTTTKGMTIKIAADLPVSGVDAGIGKPIENGARLAVDEANADKKFLPGYTLVFTPLDNTGADGYANPAVGAVNVTTLIGDAEVAGIIGPFNSAVAQSELALSNLAPVAQLGPSSTDVCLTQNTPETGCVGQNDLLGQLRPTTRVTYFRIAVTDNHQGEVGADYAFKTLGYTSAFVVDDTTPAGNDIAQAFASEFKGDGGDVLDQDSVATTTSYTQELKKIAALKPDVIYFAGQDATSAILMRKQMASTPGLELTPFMGGDELSTTAFANAIGTGGGPVYSTVATADPTKIPGTATFLAHYQKAYGQPGAYSAAGYDCAKILLNAIKAAIQAGAKVPANSNDVDTARTFRQAVINQIARTDYTGATGHQSFDANGDTTNKTITIYRLAEVNSKPAWKYATTRTL